MTNTTIRHPVLFPISVILAPFLGLCTLFALVATVAQAWQEHAQSQWPQVMATVDQCKLVPSTSSRRRLVYIRCRLRYELGFEQLSARITSASVPPREVSQYPPNQIGPLEDWVSEHPTGTPIAVRYNPTHHERIVLAVNDMPPRVGPKTPYNLKLLSAFGMGFLVFLAIAWSTRPPSGWRPQNSPAPVSS
jgi:Protein of unknown function (DUF3592)